MFRQTSVWVVMCALSCAAVKPTPSPAPAPSAPVPPPERPSEWLTKLDRDSPLVGKLWDVKARAFVEPSLLVPRLAAAKFVLLGEQHDNPDHHRLQGVVISELVKAGRRPAIVLEMLEVEQQPAIDAYLQDPGASAAGFGAALGWEKTSWPAFGEYQPIFEAAFAGKLAVVGGNLAQADAKALVKQGISALPAEQVQALGLDRAFPEPLEAQLVQELRASHCGHLPERLLGPMALAQHARDARMAKSLVAAGSKDGAVLIAGGGHARRDRGVPYYLAQQEPASSVASLVFREVRHAQQDPKSYADDEGPFDYLWFTPRVSDDDPCAAFAPPAK
jgi:uncharacterized iron-regulated protein